MRLITWTRTAILFAGLLSGCSQVTMLRTQELRGVQDEVKASRKEIADLQKSIDELNLQQSGSTSKTRADLTLMLSDLETQIGRLHADIDETQHRLAQLSQKLDKLDQRKVVAGQDSLSTRPGAAPVKIVEGLDLDHLFNQAREDYIRGKYDLAYQGFKAIYEKDNAGSFKEPSLYWMAECLWKGEKNDRALDMYQRVLVEFPNGEQRCPARMKIGLIYDQNGDSARRDSVWKELIASCPQSNEAERAKDLLKP